MRYKTTEAVTNRIRYIVTWKLFLCLCEKLDNSVALTKFLTC